MRTGLSGYRRGMGDAASAAVSGGISAGVGLATAAASLWLNSIQLSHAADTATTQIVNGLEPLLRANMNAYLAGPGTCADQAAALAAFDSAMLWLISPKGCGNGAYGSAGNACVADRSPGGKWDWTAMYRNPIANDPRATGCALSLAASNPDAAEQSAIANLSSLTAGATQQTTAGQFASSSGVTSAAVPVGSGVPFSMSDTFLGLPLWAWAAGVGAFLIFK